VTVGGFTVGLSCEALECGSLLPLSFPRACSRDFDCVHTTQPTSRQAKVETSDQPASWLAKKRQQAAAL